MTWDDNRQRSDTTGLKWDTQGGEGFEVSNEQAAGSYISHSGGLTVSLREQVAKCGSPAV